MFSFLHLAKKRRLKTSEKSLKGLWWEEKFSCSKCIRAFSMVTVEREMAVAGETKVTKGSFVCLDI